MWFPHYLIISSQPLRISCRIKVRGIKDKVRRSEDQMTKESTLNQGTGIKRTSEWDETTNHKRKRYVANTIYTNTTL